MSKRYKDKDVNPRQTVEKKVFTREGKTLKCTSMNINYEVVSVYPRWVLHENDFQRGLQRRLMLSAVISPQSVSMIYDLFALYSPMHVRDQNAPVFDIEMANMTYQEMSLFAMCLANRQYDSSDETSSLCSLQRLARQEGLWDNVGLEGLFSGAYISEKTEWAFISYKGRVERMTGEEMPQMLEQLAERFVPKLIWTTMSAIAVSAYDVSIEDKKEEGVQEVSVVVTEHISEHGEKKYTATIVGDERKTRSAGAFDDPDTAKRSAAQFHYGHIAPSDAIMCNEIDRDVPSTIRFAEYYNSDHNWDVYVTRRLPERLKEIHKIVMSVPRTYRIVAPCDGAGVVALSCAMLKRECVSTDKCASDNRIMYATVEKEDWTTTLTRVKMRDCVILSHCVEMCPTIVEQFLLTGAAVIYYGKETMFRGMTRMVQVSTNLYIFGSITMKYSLSPEMIASPLYLGQLLRYPTIGIMSYLGIKALKTLYLYDAKIKIRYFGERRSDITAFQEFALAHNFPLCESEPSVIICYSHAEIMLALGASSCTVILDMRVGTFWNNSPIYKDISEKHSITANTRVVYRLDGNVSKCSGKGVNIEDGGNHTYVWFDDPGEKTILVESKLRWSRMKIFVHHVS